MYQCFGRQGKKKKTPRQSSKKKKTILKIEESVRNILDNMKHNNICILGIPEGKESEQGINNLFEEIMTEKFPNLEKQNVSLVQEFRESPKSWTQRGLHRHTS